MGNDRLFIVLLVVSGLLVPVLLALALFHS
jgi:hypothetical protein